MKKIILMTFIIMIITANIAFGIVIVDVACGEYHTVLLAEDGTVWTMGNNTSGQCGHSISLEKINIPKKIENIPKMVKVAAGNAATMLLDENGEVYITNASGKIKKDSNMGNDCVDIAIFDSDSYAVLKQDGTVYGRASSEDDRMGFDSETSTYGWAYANGEKLTGVKQLLFSGGDDADLECITNSGEIYWQHPLTTYMQLSNDKMIENFIYYTYSQDSYDGRNNGPIQ